MKTKAVRQSGCGHKYNGLTLNIRTWACPECGCVHDRDINASINILNEVRRICTVGTTGIEACETMDSLEPSKQESPTS